MKNKTRELGQFDEQETARRRDALLKHMLTKPPKPHSEMKIGKPKEKRRKNVVKSVRGNNA
jgi:hypothetical protein